MISLYLKMSNKYIVGCLNRLVTVNCTLMTKSFYINFGFSTFSVRISSMSCFFFGVKSRELYVAITGDIQHITTTSTIIQFHMTHLLHIQHNESSTMKETRDYSKKPRFYLIRRKMNIRSDLIWCITAGDCIVLTLTIYQSTVKH